MADKAILSVARTDLKQFGLKHSPHFLIKEQSTSSPTMLVFLGKIRAFLNQQPNISLDFHTVAIFVSAIAARFGRFSVKFERFSSNFRHQQLLRPPLKSHHFSFLEYII